MKGAKSPLRVQSTRIFKLFRKFKNTHSVAKRLFRHAGAAFMAARNRVHRPPAPCISHPVPVVFLRRVRSAMVHSTRRCGTGGHKGRPYGVSSTRFVGRGAHTPPNQAALRGSAGVRWESRACSGGHKGRPYMHTPPFPVVGAHFICARTALPELTGLRSSGPGHGGMWACRPTRLGGGAVGNGGLRGRP